MRIHRLITIALAGTGLALAAFTANAQNAASAPMSPADKGDIAKSATHADKKASKARKKAVKAQKKAEEKDAD